MKKFIFRDNDLSTQILTQQVGLSGKALDLYLGEVWFKQTQQFIQSGKIELCTQNK